MWGITSHGIRDGKRIPSPGGLLLALLFLFFATVGPRQVFAASAAATEAESPVLNQAELNIFAPSFVLVKFYFKRSEEEVGRSRYSDDESMRDEPTETYSSYIEQKIPIKMVGVVVAPDTVLTIDTYLDDSYLNYIEVEDLQGGVSRAERLAILRHAPGLLLRIEQPEKMKIKPVEFTEMATPVTTTTRLFEVKVDRMPGEIFLSGRKVNIGTLFGEDGRKRSVLFSGATDTGMAWWGRSSSGYSWGSSALVKVPTLLLNEAKKPVGIGLFPYLSNEKETPPIWLGKDLLADERIQFADLKKMKEEIKKQYDGRLFEARLTFRQKAERGAGLEGLAAQYFARMTEGSSDVPKEIYCYGLPISARTLFVPMRIQRTHAKVIDKIAVKVGDKTIGGKFAGAYKDIAAFLIRLDEDVPGFGGEMFSKESVSLFEPQITVRAARKFGGKDLKINYARALMYERGYKDKLEPVPSGSQARGTYYAEPSGRIRGVLVEQRKEDEEKEQFRRGPYSGGYYQFTRLYSIGELAGHFGSPSDYFDTTIVSLPEEQEKQKMWLGVEFEPVTPELAKSLSIEKVTKDGSIGLIVSTVYPDSPATSMGLQTGDVLLKVKAVGDQEPVELREVASFDFDDFEFPEGDIPPELEKLGLKMPKKKPWKSQINVVTRLLETMGEGKMVEMTYLAKGKEMTAKQFRVEKAPHDFDSAPKYKDQDVGLTVKEVTFEVRNALMLPKELNGVVVAKVEEGSPAAVARVELYDLIVKISDAEIRGIETFKKIMEDAKKQRDAQGKVTLRFALQEKGRTRFADVTLEK